MSHDEVIRKISANFVPVAVSLQTIRTDPATKDWFRSVGRQKDQYQGVWIVSPDDKVLGGDDYGYKDAATWPGASRPRASRPRAVSDSLIGRGSLTGEAVRDNRAGRGSASPVRLPRPASR